MKKFKVKKIIFIIIACSAVIFILKVYRENLLLNKIIERLTADSRVAEALVTAVKFDPKTSKNYTTIKFLEYDTRGAPLRPKYFTFSENIIQFQAMVIRFDDFYFKICDSLKGKSAYIFMKAFALKDKGAEIFQINRENEVPSGYQVEGLKSAFERKLWRKFWEYALNAKQAKQAGIKNAQIEAPGTKFVPGLLYTVKIEHDGGLRIDSQQLSLILKGEKL